MQRTIRGTFEVTLLPQQATTDLEREAAIGRSTINKTFSGSLKATSVGQMLAFRTEVPGSAGYVAMERVSGELEGRSGSFVLQHSGTMNRGERALQLGVVPDSAGGQLNGLRGTMDIEITDGKHFYSFQYELPEQD